MPVTGWIEVNEMYCKGCEICVDECPKEVLALDNDHLTPKGYHPVILVKDVAGSPSETVNFSQETPS